MKELWRPYLLEDSNKSSGKCPCFLCTYLKYSGVSATSNETQRRFQCFCKFCGKTFTRHWLLRGHIRTHTGEKPFECHVCQKRFADKSNLRAHVQTHSHVKPWICSICGKRFALKSYLSKHRESATCVGGVSSFKNIIFQPLLSR